MLGADDGIASGLISTIGGCERRIVTRVLVDAFSPRSGPGTGPIIESAIVCGFPAGRGSTRKLIDFTTSLRLYLINTFCPGSSRALVGTGFLRRSCELMERITSLVISPARSAGEPGSTDSMIG